MIPTGVGHFSLLLFNFLEKFLFVAISCTGVFGMKASRQKEGSSMAWWVSRFDIY